MPVNPPNRTYKFDSLSRVTPFHEVKTYIDGLPQNPEEFDEIPIVIYYGSIKTIK
jgi:hypothetical protein